MIKAWAGRMQVMQSLRQEVAILDCILHTNWRVLFVKKRALLSVSDKNGILEFAKELESLGYELLSTGGTMKHLADNGVAVTAVDAVTGFPEIMEGRVKTLNPMIHGGLLAKQDDPSHHCTNGRARHPAD